LNFKAFGKRNLNFELINSSCLENSLNELPDELRFKFMRNCEAIDSMVNFMVWIIKNVDFINFQNSNKLNQVFVYHFQASYLTFGFIKEVIRYFRKEITVALHLILAINLELMYRKKMVSFITFSFDFN